MSAIRPAFKLEAGVAGLFAALGDTSVTEPVEHLALSFEGIDGDIHAGYTRKSGGREPWYARGTEMRNERQLSIVCLDELAQVASGMDIARIAPEWIGANMVLAGVPQLSMMPPRTVLFFEHGVTLRIDGQNAPCRFAGAKIAENYPERNQTELALSFPKMAKRLRGLVAWVEVPGTIRRDETVELKVPEQWIWQPD